MLYNKKIIDILLKPGESRTLDEIRELCDFTVNFSYFERFRGKKNSDFLISNFCRVMKLKIQKKAQSLFYYGDQADCFYIVILGKVAIFIPRKVSEMIEEKNKNQKMCSDIDNYVKVMKKRAKRAENDQGIFYNFFYFERNF